MKINKKLISLSSLTLLIFSLFLVSCEEDVATDNPIGNINYIGIESAKFAWIPEGETVTVDVAVVASQTSSSDRVVGLQFIEGEDTDLVPDADPASYTLPTSVTIPAGETQGTFSINISATDYAKKKVTVELVPDESFHIAVADYSEVELEDGTVVVEDVEYSRFVLFAQRPCPDTIVTLSITTDDWPDETSWQLYDLSGTPTIIAEGGPFNNPADDFTTKSFEFCLAPGNYGIIVYDSYGDGIVGGGYVVTAGGVVLTSGVVSGTSGSSTFTVD